VLKNYFFKHYRNRVVTESTRTIIDINDIHIGMLWEAIQVDHLGILECFRKHLEAIRVKKCHLPKFERHFEC